MRGQQSDGLLILDGCHAGRALLGGLAGVNITWT